MTQLAFKIKTSLRISHNSLDNEIDDNIDSCVLDLIRVGIQPYQVDSDGDYLYENGNKILKDDSLIRKAIELYCKGTFNYLNKAEIYNKAYEKLRDAISLCGDYNVQ